MVSVSLIREERIGLIVALAAHAALVVLLVLRPPVSISVPPPERITVTLSEDIGLTSTSPDPTAQPAPDQAPELGEQPEPQQEVLLQPKATPEPKVTPSPRPVPKPMAKTLPKPRPLPAATAAPRPRSSATASPYPQPTRAGGSRIGNDFLKGVPGTNNTGTTRNPPGQMAGPQVRASLAQSVLRQVRPHWQGRVPQGVNTEALVTVLSIELNRDGTLVRTPTVIRQEGVDDLNRQQAARHAEEAIRAIQLAAPFELPPELYDAWKKLPPLKFRKSI